MRQVIRMTITISSYDTSQPTGLFEYIKLTLGDDYEQHGLFYFHVITKLLLVANKFDNEKDKK